MLQQELYRKHMQDEQGRRKKELLEQVLARQAAAAEGKRYTLEEAQQIDADLRAAEAAANADYEETVPSAPKEKEPELLKAVKLEPADEDWIEEVKELSSLRMCNLCNTRNYLRQGLCCNMYCQAFFMLDPHAGEKLTSRGKYEHGAKWSPYDWQKHAHDRIECSQLAQAFLTGIQEHAQELEEAMLPPPQVEGAAPFIADSVIIEDLDSGEKHEHPPSVPPLETMPDEYKQAIMESSKKKASKGVKRVLSLHAAIQKKKQKGLWVGPQIPMAGLTNDQQSWMNERVGKAIEIAPWHRK